MFVNLTSDEDFKVVKQRLLDVPVITPVFEDWKNGQYKGISFYPKRARVLMARHAAIKGITHPEKLKSFNGEGYGFDATRSSESAWIFSRKNEMGGRGAEVKVSRATPGKNYGSDLLP